MTASLTPNRLPNKAKKKVLVKKTTDPKVQAHLLEEVTSVGLSKSGSSSGSAASPVTDSASHITDSASHITDSASPVSTAVASPVSVSSGSGASASVTAPDNDVHEVDLTFVQGIDCVADPRAEQEYRQQYLLSKSTASEQQQHQDEHSGRTTVDAFVSEVTFDMYTPSAAAIRKYHEQVAATQAVADAQPVLTTTSTYQMPRAAHQMPQSEQTVSTGTVDSVSFHDIDEILKGLNTPKEVQQDTSSFIHVEVIYKGVRHVLEGPKEQIQEIVMRLL